MNWPMTRPFLYPNFTWAYNKIEKAIKAMGERGTKIPEHVDIGGEVKKTVWEIDT